MISTQAARLQEEEDSQFEIINKLEREAGKHRERAEAAKKEASRIDGETGSAEAEKRRGEAEVSDLRDALADAKSDLDDTSDAYARLSQALSSSEPLDRDVAALVQTTLDAKGQELAEAEAETEKEADEALRREESVVAEKRNAVEGAADEVAALAPKVHCRRPSVASTAWGVTRRRRDRCVDGVGIAAPHRHTITHAGRRGRAHPTRGRRPAAEAAERHGRVPDASEEEGRRPE